MLPSISLAHGSVTLDILTVLTLLTLGPALLVMTTSFTRIIIVLSFLRSALNTQQMPPNAVLIGIALFLTFFVMSPVFTAIDRDALQPYLQHRLTGMAALTRAQLPLRTFMLKQTRPRDLQLFVSLAKTAPSTSSADLPLHIVIPSFITSELKTAFQIGFVIYLPFLIIDLVVATVLMSMGMMMLPPTSISLPFKLILFVLVDGWYLLHRALVLSFQ